jgi:hypothetical protein
MDGMSKRPPAESDPNRPPRIPVLVFCLHCQREYESYLIQWVNDEHDGTDGSWKCPTPGCQGAGFGMDIFPVDPEYRDDNGELIWAEGDDVSDVGALWDDEELDWAEVDDDADLESDMLPPSYFGDEDELPY